MGGAESSLAGRADLLRHLDLDRIGQDDRSSAVGDPFPAVPGYFQVVEKVDRAVVPALGINLDVERRRSDSHLPAPAGSPEGCLDPGEKRR